MIYLCYTKKEVKAMDTQLFLQQAYELVRDENHLVANLANISAFLNEILHDINWVGFYLLEDNELVLGPFQGRVACTRLPIGQGVCGKAALLHKVVCVPDVHQFSGHIACDSRSKSGIVLPIIVNNNLVAVLDIDSPSFNRFTTEDQKFLESIVEIIEEHIFKKANKE